MTTHDDEVMELRSRGRSYARIARDLGFDRTSQASEAFNRAIRGRPVEERAALRDEENQRLDALAELTRRRPGLSAEDVERRLRTIETLRRRMLTD
jgi:hypothetical protein